MPKVIYAYSMSSPKNVLIVLRSTFMSILSWFLRRMWGPWIHFFTCGCPGVPTSFVGKTSCSVASPLLLWQRSVSRIYVGLLLVSLFALLVDMPVLSSDHTVRITTALRFEVGWCQPLTSFFFSAVLTILCLFHLQRHFRTCSLRAMK